MPHKHAKAKRDLVEHYVYLAEQGGTDLAERFLTQFDDAEGGAVADLAEAGCEDGAVAAGPCAGGEEDDKTPRSTGTPSSAELSRLFRSERIRDKRRESTIRMNPEGARP